MDPRRIRPLEVAALHEPVRASRALTPALSRPTGEGGPSGLARMLERSRHLTRCALGPPASERNSPSPPQALAGCPPSGEEGGEGYPTRLRDRDSELPHPIMKASKPDRSSPATDDAPPRIYRLKVTVDLLEPPIWRRLEFPGDLPIDFLDHAIRTAFGWTCDHGSEFVIKGRRYGTPTDWLLDRDALFLVGERRIRREHLPRAEELERLKALRIEVYGHSVFDDVPDADEQGEEEEIPLLCELVQRVRTKFRYHFDFGDSWWLTAEVESIQPPHPGAEYPRCIDGARANPVEDCGGVWAHAEFIAAAKDPHHGCRERLLEWMGPKWDPEHFSVDEVNRRLRKAFPPPRPDRD